MDAGRGLTYGGETPSDLSASHRAQLSLKFCFLIGEQPHTLQRLDPDSAIIVAGIRLGTYSPLKRALGGDEEHISLLRNLVAGSIAGGVAAAGHALHCGCRPACQCALWRCPRRRRKCELHALLAVARSYVARCGHIFAEPRQ